MELRFRAEELVDRIFINHTTVPNYEPKNHLG